MTRIIDLRSDTVTRPTDAMRKAMAEAEVGDDVFSEDPTALRLQDRVASMLGFESGLFMPSGVMANEVAIRLWTRPGDEVLCDAHSHVVDYELSGMAVFSGVIPRTVVTARGHVTASDVLASKRPKSYFRSEITLLVLEHAQSGRGDLTSKPYIATDNRLQGRISSGGTYEGDLDHISFGWQSAGSIGVCQSHRRGRRFAKRTDAAGCNLCD